MDKFKIAISIVVYDTPVDSIQKVLNYFEYYENRNNLFLTIVDNGSSDILRSFCLLKKIKYIRPSSNIGFGKGHNLAVRSLEFEPDYCLILNPDVFINVNSIKSIIDFMDLNKEIVLLSPRLNNPDGSIQPICRLLPSPLNIVKRFFSNFILNNNIVKDYSQDKSLIPLCVPALHGACFFVKYDSFLSVNGFSNDYFLYLEDIDLCRKLWALGKIVYFPNTSAIHLHQKASRKSLRFFVIHLKSFYSYFLKYGFVFDSFRTKINSKSYCPDSNFSS